MKTEVKYEPFKLYKNKMEKIEFMQKYLQEPEIFNQESTKFRNFLIQSFCHLHSDFHYLSFRSQKNVDKEIIKVASILQILPGNFTKKCSKLFENMSEEDIHKFWVKFFSLFKLRNDYSPESLSSLNWDTKISFFKSMESSLNYLNYECPIVNVNRLKNIDLSAEVNSWKEQTCGKNITKNESELSYCDVDYKSEVCVDQMLSDLKEVTTLYSNTHCIKEENKPEHLDFFLSFVRLTKNFLQFKNYLSNYNTSFLNEFSDKVFSNDETLLQNLFFVKKCCNFVKSLKLKLNILQ